MDVFIERQQISLGLFHIDLLISTNKLQAVDRSAIQFLSNFGVLLTEMCSMCRGPLLVRFLLVQISN